MNTFNPPAAWEGLVDYEKYARSHPYDDKRVTFPEEGDTYHGTFTDQNQSSNPPLQGEISEQALVSDNTEGRNVGEARKEENGEENEVSAQNPRSPPAASTPLIIQHPMAPTIPGRTNGWKSCDTCHTRKRRCDHGEDGFIDPELAARAHKKRKTKA